jgi:hypothetical protein
MTKFLHETPVEDSPAADPSAISDLDHELPYVPDSCIEPVVAEPKFSKLRRLLGRVPTKKAVETVEPDETATAFSEQVYDGSEDITKVMELVREGEFVKTAPVFVEQVQDKSRTNIIEYVAGQREALATETNDHILVKGLTEHESLQGLYDFLETVADSDSTYAADAQSMIENLTFIGGSEYQEAAQAIAGKWLARLHENPNVQICVITNNESRVKSSEYLLDAILGNISDNELEKVQGRIITDPNMLTAEPEDCNIILLDDWVISGSQIKSGYATVIDTHPQYKNSIEVQLLAATEDRIKNGLIVTDWSLRQPNKLPINAYYAAHAASADSAPKSGAHITGAHCATDFDFNNKILVMAQDRGVDMPPATNIVRPYRKPGVVLENLRRL